VVVLNKIDLADLLGFNLEQVRDDLSRINTRAPLIVLSARTGEGFDAWLDWLRESRNHL